MFRVGEGGVIVVSDEVVRWIWSVRFSGFVSLEDEGSV